MAFFEEMTKHSSPSLLGKNTETFSTAVFTKLYTGKEALAL